MNVQAIVVDGEVVGLVSDPRLARTFQAERHPGARLVPLEVTYSKRDLKDALEETEGAAPTTGPVADPDDVLRGQIRTQLAEERRRERIETEVRAELDAEEKADKKGGKD